jgi:hypothetical protein
MATRPTIYHNAVGWSLPQRRNRMAFLHPPISSFLRYSGRPLQELLPAWKRETSDMETPDARVTRVSTWNRPPA